MTDSKIIRAIEIAKDNSIVPSDRFVRFLVEWSDIRGKDWTKDAGYAGEWAGRFRKETEYIDASGDALVALVHVDGAKDAVRRFTKQLARYNNDVPIKNIEKDVKERLTIAFESQKQTIPQEFKGYNTHAHKSIAKSAPKNDCICKSAKKMIGKLPNFDKNFEKITR